MGNLSLAQGFFPGLCLPCPEHCCHLTGASCSLQASSQTVSDLLTKLGCAFREEMNNSKGNSCPQARHLQTSSWRLRAGNRGGRSSEMTSSTVHSRTFQNKTPHTLPRSPALWIWQRWAGFLGMKRSRIYSTFLEDKDEMMAPTTAIVAFWSPWDLDLNGCSDGCIHHQPEHCEASFWHYLWL